VGVGVGLAEGVLSFDLVGLGLGVADGLRTMIRLEGSAAFGTTEKRGVGLRLMVGLGLGDVLSRVSWIFGDC
jgi:hypothetical protein